VESIAWRLGEVETPHAPYSTIRYLKSNVVRQISVKSTNEINRAHTASILCHQRTPETSRCYGMNDRVEMHLVLRTNPGLCLYALEALGFWMEVGSKSSAASRTNVRESTMSFSTVRSLYYGYHNMWHGLFSRGTAVASRGNDSDA
jgi:hypothetical protein